MVYPSYNSMPIELVTTWPMLASPRLYKKRSLSTLHQSSGGWKLTDDVNHVIPPHQFDHIVNTKCLV